MIGLNTNKNVPNMWFFGCSMTYGAHCHKGDEYYEKYHQDNDYIWTSIVAKHYNFNEINLGDPGCGNMEILRKILDFKKLITHDDIVIIGSTDGSRTLSFLRENNTIIPKSFNHWLFDGYPWREKGISDDFVSSFQQYSINCRLPFIDEHIKFDTKLMEDVIELISPNTYFIWGPEMWAKFENIAVHTKNKIYDFHWSFNGHREMSEWVISNIK